VKEERGKEKETVDAATDVAPKREVTAIRQHESRRLRP